MFLKGHLLFVQQSYSEASTYLVSAFQSYKSLMHDFGQLVVCREVIALMQKYTIKLDFSVDPQWELQGKRKS